MNINKNYTHKITVKIVTVNGIAETILIPSTSLYKSNELHISGKYTSYYAFAYEVLLLNHSNALA